jgi:hypothetical protein
VNTFPYPGSNPGWVSDLASPDQSPVGDQFAVDSIFAKLLEASLQVVEGEEMISPPPLGFLIALAIVGFAVLLHYALIGLAP